MYGVLTNSQKKKLIDEVFDAALRLMCADISSGRARRFLNWDAAICEALNGKASVEKSFRSAFPDKNSSPPTWKWIDSAGSAEKRA